MSAAASTGAMRIETAPVASFHSAAARCSCTSGWGERFSNGSTSWAGKRTTRLGIDGAGELAAGAERGLQRLGGLVVGNEQR